MFNVVKFLPYETCTGKDTSDKRRYAHLRHFEMEQPVCAIDEVNQPSIVCLL